MALLWGAMLCCAGIPARAGDLTGAVLQLLQPGLPLDYAPDGDPFAPLVGDAHGWWAPGFVPPEGSVRTFWRRNDFLTRRLTDGHSRADFQARGLVVGGRHRNLSGALGLARESLYLDYVTSEDSYSYTEERDRASLLTRLSTEDGAWTLQVAWPLLPDLENEHAKLGFGLRRRVSEGLLLEGHFEVSSTDGKFDFRVAGEGIETRLNKRQRTVELGGRWRIVPGWEWQGRLKQRDYTALRPISDEPVYEIDPHGRSRSVLAMTTLAPRESWDLVLRGTNDELDAEAESYWGGRQFGEMTYLVGEEKSVLLGARYQSTGGWSLVGDVQLARLRARTRLSTRTWPFTDALGDLLGLTATGRGWVEASWQRWHLGLRWQAAGYSRELGLLWFNILPDGFLRESHSGPIGIGHWAESHDLVVDHLQLGALTWNWRQNWGAWGMEMRLFQFVMASSHGYSPPDSEPGEPPDDLEGSTGGWWGGTWAYLSLSMAF